MPLTLGKTLGASSSQRGTRTHSQESRSRSFVGNAVLQAHNPSTGGQKPLIVTSSLTWPRHRRTAWGETLRWVDLSCCSLSQAHWCPHALVPGTTPSHHRPPTSQASRLHRRPAPPGSVKAPQASPSHLLLQAPLAHGLSKETTAPHVLVCFRGSPRHPKMLGVHRDHECFLQPASSRGVTSAACRRGMGVGR